MTILTDTEAMALLASDDITDTEITAIVAGMAAAAKVDSHAFKVVIDWGDETETYYRSEPLTPNAPAAFVAAGAVSVTVTARPAIGTRVQVTFPGNDWHDPETVEGVVTGTDGDSIDVSTGEAIGETFTLYDAEQTTGVTVVVL